MIRKIVFGTPFSEYPKDVLKRYSLVKQIRHGVHEVHCRFLAVQGLGQTRKRQRQMKTVLITARAGSSGRPECFEIASNHDVTGSSSKSLKQRDESNLVTNRCLIV